MFNFNSNSHSTIFNVNLRSQLICAELIKAGQIVIINLFKSYNYYCNGKCKYIMSFDNKLAPNTCLLISRRARAANSIVRLFPLPLSLSGVYTAFLFLLLRFTAEWKMIFQLLFVNSFTICVPRALIERNIWHKCAINFKVEFFKYLS